VRFGIFEVDLRSGELRKPDSKMRLQDKPLQILTLLMEHPGEVVTREELQKRLWTDGIIVDFEHSINTAVKRLREALGDDAEHPRFIETLPRHGYRFIAPVDRGAMQELPLPTSGPRAIHQSPLRRHWAVAVAGGLVVAVVAMLFTLNIASLRDRMVTLVQARHVVPPPKIDAIAVLPFENLSHDPEQEYFADGMTDELITNLGKISGLSVISRTSVMRYKGTMKALPEIARELNVNAVVEGAILCSRGRVRITAQLIRANPEKHLWADGYERGLADVLTLQAEVAQAITNEIQIKVTPQEHARLGSARPVDPEAYQAYLKGSTILDNLTEESGQLAIQYFERAIERDPTFAPAFAGLADAYIFQGRFHYRPPNEMFREAKPVAAKALALDANSAEAYDSLCSIATFCDWDWRAAEMACQRAIELNPSYGPAHHIYSHYFISTGRFAESLRESLRYLELDPLSPAAKTHLGMHYKMARQYDLAIEELRKTIEQAPNFPDAYGELASSYIGKGAYQEAVPPARKAVMLTGGKGYLGLLGEAYAMGGRRSEATRVLEEIRGMSHGGFVPARSTVPVLIALGERDGAIEVLQRAYEEHDQLIPYLKVWCMFDPLRSDPRFQDLLRRMNFPP
jgi:TolB-like protein/DNA-binding winged helix-turn-helix (wHTH) protein